MKIHSPRMAENSHFEAIFRHNLGSLARFEPLRAFLDPKLTLNTDFSVNLMMMIDYLLVKKSTVGIGPQAG